MLLEASSWRILQCCKRWWNQNPLWTHKIQEYELFFETAVVSSIRGSLRSTLCLGHKIHSTSSPSGTSETFELTHHIRVLYLYWIFNSAAHTTTACSTKSCPRVYLLISQQCISTLDSMINKNRQHESVFRRRCDLNREDTDKLQNICSLSLVEIWIRLQVNLKENMLEIEPDTVCMSASQWLMPIVCWRMAFGCVYYVH